ncbi:purine permease, partial [Bacillus cereus]|nr:purine permease [Bacillus cereus]
MYKYKAMKWCLCLFIFTFLIIIGKTIWSSLDGAEAIAFVQRTLFVLGFAGLLQA